MNNLYTVSNSGAAIHVPEGSSLTMRAGSDQDVLYSFARLWSWNRRKQRRGHGKITIESGMVVACSGMSLTDKGPEKERNRTVEPESDLVRRELAVV